MRDQYLLSRVDYSSFGVCSDASLVADSVPLSYVDNISISILLLDEVLLSVVFSL